MEDQSLTPPEAPAPRRRRGLRILLVTMALLLLAAAIGSVWLGSDSARRYAASRINGLSFENGMEVTVERIEGSLFGEMRVVGLKLSDPKGVFLRSPEVRLDWNPLPLAVGHLDIRSLVIPRAYWLRVPQLKSGPRDQPLLPDMDIDIDRLELRALDVAPAVTGRRHVVTMSGNAHIADRRAQIALRARTVAGAGRSGGDRLSLLLDAVPENNRLKIDTTLTSAPQGLFAGLVGVKEELGVFVKGQGDWQAWRGHLAGRVGKEAFADLALSARNGLFAVTGPARPAVLLGDAAPRLFDPGIQLALKARARERRLTLDGGVSGEGFRMALGGDVDLGQSAMRKVGIAFELVKPGFITDTISGAGVTARIALDGAFAAPDIAYTLDAQRMAFGETNLEGLALSGSASLDKDRWLIPVKGRVDRISGINPSLEPLLVGLTVDGRFAYANSRLLADDIRLRSSRVDARAAIVADLEKGVYTGGLQGRVDNYRVESVGIFNLETDIDLKTGSPDYFRLAGRVTARSTRLLSDGLAGFLGGNALVVADVGYDSNGIATIDRMNVVAPDFRLTGGTGVYRLDGTIRFAARGRSARYGPLALLLSGTAARPVARVSAPRPGLGVGLSDVTALVSANGNGYRIAGKGLSDYGPVEARLTAWSGNGRLRLELLPGTRFSGVGLTGALDQTRGGPFAGSLLARGGGVNGRLMLAPLGQRQRIEAHLRANQARLPGRIGFSADRAILDADIVLYERPHVVADLQLAGTQLGSLYIAAARGRVNYRSGAGSVQLLAEGRTRHLFRIALNSALKPDLWLVAVKGRFNGIPVATRQPLRIVPERNGYSLLSSALEAGQGVITLVGHYGRGTSIQARLADVDLALANPFWPELGLGGKVTGSLDFAQSTPDRFPSADARLQIGGFSRTSLASVSAPVDINIVGRLLPDGGNAAAVVRRRGAVVGRMQVFLRPLGPAAGTWLTRLLAAPLSGGLRYNGPADALFSLAALPDQSLAGPIGVAADFTGRVNAPQIAGLVRANNLTYENADYGTRLTRMQLRGSFTGDRLLVESLTARAGGGTVTGQGFVSLSSSQGYPAQLSLDLDRARIASGDDLSAVATGQVRVVNAAGQLPTITGRLRLPETRYRIVRQGGAQIATLTGVRRKPSSGLRRITGDAEPEQRLPADWKLDVAIEADNEVFVTGMGLNSEWAADLHAGGTTNAPAFTGGITLLRGTLSFAGRSFDLTEGRLRSTGAGMRPEMRVVATGDVEGVTTNITITGTSENPQIAFTSTPSLPRDELMARILFGNSVGQLSAIQAVQLAASLNSLRGKKGGLNPLGVLQSSAGIDRLRILGADEETGRETSVALGKYISNDVYIEIVTDARGYTAAQIEVSLSRALSVLSEMGSFGSSSVGLRYRKDY